jgi:hypothetical protein
MLDRSDHTDLACDLMQIATTLVRPHHGEATLVDVSAQLRMIADALRPAPTPPAPSPWVLRQLTIATWHDSGIQLLVDNDEQANVIAAAFEAIGARCDIDVLDLSEEAA